MIKGSRHSEEAKRKNSIAHLGKEAWNKGSKGIMKPNKTSFKKGAAPWNKGKPNPSITGKKHPLWKNGKTTTVAGYISVLVLPNRRMLEHRYVMEQHLGRKLKTQEHVHHIDHDKSNNRIENLELITSSDHSKRHIEQQWESGGSLRKLYIRH